MVKTFKQMKVEILRNEDQTVETKGKISVLNDSDATIFSCLTLELPWLDNKTGVSCIPPNVYICKKVPPSHIPYNHISITGVANREGICIHYGNFAAMTTTEIEQGKHPDILGCVITGDKYADINGDGIDDICDSKATFEKLMSILPDTFLLTIK